MLIEEYGRLELPERNGVRANLDGVNLRYDSLKMRLGTTSHQRLAWWDKAQEGINLQGASLQGATFRDARLQRANLREANLQYACLYRVRF